MATVSRIDTIIGLFCGILSLLFGSFAKETYNFIDPTNQSHPISYVGPYPLDKFGGLLVACTRAHLCRLSVCCSVLQGVAVCCRVLQCVAACCSVFQVAGAECVRRCA